MKTAIVYLYGLISIWSENSAEEFSARLDEAAADSDVIELHVHCYGGDVLEGNAIYNKIKTCPIPVDVYIDGVAASMATIVMLAARNIYMSENAFLMIHAPSGYVDGTAEDIEKTVSMLKSLESLIVKFYTNKTGKTDSEVKAWLKGDNWFSSQEALDNNLVDGLVNPISEEIEQPAKAELKTIKPKALYDRYAAKLATPPRFNNKSKNEMEKQALIARYGLTGLDANASDEAIMAAIDAKIKAEKDKADGLVQEKEAAQKKAITDKVLAAKTAGKITAEQVAQFEKIGNDAGVEALETALAAIKPIQSISAALSGRSGNASAAGRETWGWDQYQKEDPRALEVMAKENPDAFKALYDAKYKK